MAMNPTISDWHGKYVWIIGASTGIGAETARLLLERGATVALSARRQEVLEQVANHHPQSTVMPLDITDAASVLASKELICKQWPHIDLVLIVAGAYNEMRVDSLDLERVNQLIDINIRGVFNCLHTVLPIMLRRGRGAIGIVSSVAGYSGLPKALIYGPTKAALINLAESLYLDLQPRGIGVYLINPGFVETPLTANNDFPMPALMSPQAAAAEIVRGIERGEFHIHFPKRFTNWLRLARLLPYRVYFWLIHKVTGL
jgi:short-subunit dehydrogenase